MGFLDDCYERDFVTLAALLARPSLSVLALHGEVTARLLYLEKLAEHVEKGEVGLFPEVEFRLFSGEVAALCAELRVLLVLRNT